MNIKRWSLAALIGMLILVACADNNTLPGAAPTAPPALSDACDVADHFLKAWDANDYPSMYNLISSKSMQLDQKAFAADYDQVDKTLGQPTKTHFLDCSAAQQQGTTAVISYDMVFKGGAMGEFTDPKRTMRLVLTPRGWRVAWSTMDIFEGMAGGATPQLVTNFAPRGTIYDRNGKPLAQDGQTLYTVTLLTENFPGNAKADDCYNMIAHLFKRRFVEVQASYKPEIGLQYGEVVGHFDQEAYDAHHAELDAVCNVNYKKQTTRVYYGNGLAAQSIGYIGAIPNPKDERYITYPSGALVGLDGIEAKFEPQLSGQAGATLSIRLPNNTLIRTIASTQPKPSQDVKLTIDRELQAAAEQAISDAHNYAQPNWAQYATGTAAIVINIQTGEILAIASYPTFDVDVFNLGTSFHTEQLLPKITSSKAGGRSALTNLVTKEYSPLGSVFKIVSMAAAADSGTFKLNQTYNCTGKWVGTKFNDSKPYRWDWIGTDPYFKDKNNQHGVITLVQALTASCDAYFWEVGGTLNQKDAGLLSKYAVQMGLGQQTGITDLEDLTGKIPSPDNIGELAIQKGRSWDIGDALNMVIGQGDVRVTPIQVARMIAAVANPDGTLYKPYMVETVGSQIVGTPTAQGTIGIDTKKVLPAIREGMCGVTMDDNLGTAHWFLKNWDFSKIMLCGKTGTAQNNSPHPNGWFAAYAGPTGKPPEIAVVALVEHGREGSETAGPIVRRIIEAYYKIPYNDWPPFWSTKYEDLVDPDSVSDGGRH